MIPLPGSGTAAGSRALLDEIFGRIRQRGALPFDEFMELALYSSPGGYYERGAEIIGRGGDYYTAAEATPAFGALLARQVCECFDRLAEDDCPGRFDLVELGAGRGTMAAAIMDELRAHRRDLYDRTNYWIVDRSAAMRLAQQQSLQGHDTHARVRWANRIEDIAAALPSGGRFESGDPGEAEQSGHVVAPARVRARSGPREGIVGCVIANEFYDALPVRVVVRRGESLMERRVGLDAPAAGAPAGNARDFERQAGSAAPAENARDFGRQAGSAAPAGNARDFGRQAGPAAPAGGNVRELSRLAGVAAAGGSRLRWVEIPATDPELLDYASRYGLAPADGAIAEAGLAAREEARRVARAIRKGYQILIDYGDRAARLYDHAARPAGTLLAYHRHQASEDVLARVGEQDLTAHVNFSALEDAGIECGLTTAGFTTQDRFLVALGLAERIAQLGGSADPDDIHRRLAMMALIHPEGMGRIFRVLVQAKDAPAALSGLTDPYASAARGHSRPGQGA